MMTAMREPTHVAIFAVDASAQVTSQRILLIIGIVACCALVVFINVGIFWAAARKGGQLLLIITLIFGILFGLVLLTCLACGISMKIALAISDGSAFFVTGIYLYGLYM
jgi:hypothetical protein